MPCIEIPYGEETLRLPVSEEVLGEVIRPQPVPEASDPSALIREALARPIGSPPLHLLVRPGEKVAVVMDDITRKTPTRTMLPPVLAELAHAGVSPADIRIVIALGTHRPMTPDELRIKVGPEICAAYTIVNGHSGSEGELCRAESSFHGIPAWINRSVMEADRVIGLGMITPHLDTGFSGGSKIILPGVCGPQTVTAFHEQIMTIGADQLGETDAVLRLALEKFVAETVGLSFIVNAVLEHRDRLYRCVAGDPVAAHRAGVTHARRVYAVPVRRRYPVVIADASPHQIDLWQATKALAAGQLMTQDRGTLILVAACPEKTGPHPRFADYIGMGIETLLDLWNRGKIEDRLAAAEAAAICRMKQRIRIGLVSSGLGPQDTARMGMAWHDTLESAVSAALAVSEERKIGVLLHGGSLLPELTDG